MLKGLPIGIVLGAFLVFGLFRAVEARRDTSTAAAAKPESNAKEVFAEAAAAEAEVARLEAERTKLEGEVQALDAKIAAAKKGKGTSKPAVASTFRNPWSPMAKKLFLLKDKLDEIQNEDSEEYRDLMLQFMEIAKELMEEDGFELNEFEHSPYGTPMLMLAVLEGAEPPVDPETLLKAQDAVAKAQAAWKALKERKEDLSELERERGAVAIVWGAVQGIRGELTPEQLDWFKTGRMWSDTARISTWPVAGKREDVETQLLGELAGTLKMTGAEAPLRPVVNKFLRDYESMEAAWKLKEGSGQPLSAAEKALARADLAIQLEKRIKESVNLTDEQQKALKSLGHAWEITLSGE